MVVNGGSRAFWERHYKAGLAPRNEEDDENEDGTDPQETTEPTHGTHPRTDPRAPPPISLAAQNQFQ